MPTTPSPDPRLGTWLSRFSVNILTLTRHDPPAGSGLAAQIRAEHSSTRRKCGNKRERFKHQKLEIVRKPAPSKHFRHHKMAIDQVHFCDVLWIELVSTGLRVMIDAGGPGIR